MSANFTPELNSYTDLTPFRYWCQKVLPLVYDDSLSYYELLCKMVDYLNKTMEDVNLAVEDVGKLRDAYDSLQTYVNTYFDNLDVQEEINNKLDEMVEDGTIRNIFSEDVQDILDVASEAAQQAIADIPENVTDWLEEHITQETGYVIDDTLTVQGAAADAKKTGDEISALKSDLNTVVLVEPPHNYADTSEYYEWGITSDMTVEYGDNSVSYSYPYESGNKANFGLWFDGLEDGETYTIEFDVSSGTLGDASQIKITGLSPSKAAYSLITAMTKDGNHYSATFVASINSITPYNALNLSMIRSISTSVTLSNLNVTKQGDTSTKRINNDLLSDVPENVLEGNLQQKINITNYSYTDSNLFDKTQISAGYINASTGEVSPTGSAYSATGFIRITAGKRLYFHNIMYGYCAFYSTDNVSGYISGISYMDTRADWNVSVPNNAQYARFTVINENLDTAWINTINRQPTGADILVIKENVLPYQVSPTNPCVYSGDDIAIFHKIICIGDSITEGVCNYSEGGQSVANVAFPNYAYPTYLRKITGCEVTNKGRAGATTKQWYDNNASQDLSGYDCAVIILGINDALYNGGWTTEEETALNNIVGKLKSENNNIKIFIATTCKGMAYGGSSFDSVNDGIRAYVTGKADVNIALIDINAYGHTIERTAYNAGHLTAYGYLTLAKDIKAIISHAISNNPENYRFVQFIGTTHSY